MKNKAQTAMEYLMTYGWAILIIIVVVAALYSLGVFSVKTTVACSPCFGYFAYRDFDSSNWDVYIRNGARTIASGSLVITGGSVSLTSPNDCALSTCAPGVDITITLTTNTGDQILTIQYDDADSTVTHSDTATIHTGN